MTRVWEKLGRLKSLAGVSIARLRTRRRPGFLWQDWCVQAIDGRARPRIPRHSNC